MHVLISGAGIAGLASALELGTRGHDVTVVEYGRHFRLEGTPIDIRGDAIEAVDRMGLLERIHDLRLRMSESSRFVDDDGTPVGRVPIAEISDSDDIEILRADLVRVLADALPASVTIRFGDSIQTVTDHGDDVRVRFDSGRTGRYDLVIGADGQHSAVRDLVFGPERNYVRHLGVYFALADLPGEEWSDGVNSIYNVPDRLAGIFRYGGRTVAVFQFRSGPLDYDHHDLDAQKRILFDAFADYRSWKIPRLLDAVRAAPEFFFDAASQIHLPSWHRGRVVLVGDAGYCPAFLSGRGTSLALTGAHFLAAELEACGNDHTAAFERYEARLRPHVTFAQEIVDLGRDHLLPATWDAIAARNERLRAASTHVR
ncbi:FAD-binding protein [Nocardia uniformis]|uniref:FAD-binding protein n=1 Tax=Nocardia uniformis TaxID=53432 RepID=A0A849CFQ4_9NOCA|nr:FAD-dependent monooxygenase [Nocardia uniformis]NNH75387.1 FAD-binding protein [Nocardia uniformis]